MGPDPSAAEAQIAMHADAFHEPYRERILEYFQNPFHRGRAPRPTHAYQETQPLCGDLVRIELVIDESGVIQEAFFDGRGCCLSQAAASILVEWAQGKTTGDVQKVSEEAMLALIGVPITAYRRPCALLSWRVILAALEKPVGANDGPNVA